MTSIAPKDTKQTNIQLQQTPIAIVGMASIFPQSRNLQEYWQKIVGKEDCITDVPPSRWNIDDYYDPDPTAPDKTYCKRGGFIPEVDFNPMEFGIPPNQLEVTDISQLLALLVAKEALKDAGYEDLKSFDREHTGVVLGVALARQLTMPLGARLQYPVWEKALKSSGIADADIETIINKIKNAYVDWEPNAFPGMLANIVSGRIANRFDLGGMNCIVDAACASSFGALSMAIAELTSGRANMMLTGGVDTDNSIMAYMCFSKTPAVSPSEKTKPFDVDSDGMMLGEGVGMLVLKRLSDAERDGDRIYAVIKGVGSSSDGRHKSIYAPRPEGQVRALRRAYQSAGFEPTTVGVIEAHGTGTMAGDPAEFTAIDTVFSQNNPHKQQIALGSVKSQIGHTKAAAGAASLIKTALALHHKILPPTINVTKPNPKLEIENSPFYLNTETRPWLKQTEVPRRAGVSSFGFGGTNYHIVLEEHQPEHQDVYRLHNSPQAILIDAPTPEKLVDRCYEILQQLQSETSAGYFIELIKESKTKEIPAEAARIGFVAVSAFEAGNKLQKGINSLQKQSQLTHWDHPLGIFYRQAGMETKGKVVALFSGQSSQYLEMGRELTMNFPSLRETYSQVDRLFEQDDLPPISKAVFPPPVFNQEHKQQQIKVLQQTEIAQPAIAAFSTGLYKVLQRAGFKPDFVAGHSFGELTALWAAGVLSDEDYFFLVKARGQAMATEGEAGAMLAVQGDADRVRSVVENSESVAIANCNSPQQVVLAGDKTAIVRAQALLEKQGYSATMLPVSAAFHTPQVGHAQAPFAKAVETATFNRPQIPVFTNVSGNPYPNEPQECQKILKQHLLSQVLFQKEIENIYAAGGTCFVEFGPRSILTHLVKEILGDRPHLAVALNASRQKDSDLQFREAVVQLRVAGLSLPNLDPYQVVQTKQEEKHPLNVSLTSVNYVSEKTKQSKQTLYDGENGRAGGNASVQEAYLGQHSLAPFGDAGSARYSTPARGDLEKGRRGVLKDISIPLVPKGIHFNNGTASHNGETGRMEDREKGRLGDKKKPRSILENNFTVANTVSNSNATIKSKQNGHSKKLATMNEVSTTPTSPNNLEKHSGSSEIPLERILGSLEYSLTQFHLHQQETLAVHKQYLNYQSQYAQTFFELMQQQNGLWANVQTAPQEIEVKTAVIESAERSITKFQEHQANTLQVHQQYLNHQAKYAQNFFLLTQQSYSQFLTGDFKLGASNGRAIAPLFSEDEIVTIEPEKTLSNGNGHYAESKLETETVNGNGHHSQSEHIDKVVNSKEYQYYPESKVVETEVVETEVVNSNGHHSESKLVNDHETVSPSVATVSPSLPEIDFATLSETLLDVVSEKTGYPAEMLELDMDMEADLGIDSIKRVEILGALQEEMPDLPQPSLEDLSELLTLKQIIDYLRSYASTTEVEIETSVAADTSQESEPAIFESFAETFLSIISEKTGYPVQALNLEMSMKDDLGIDSVKRGEIFKSLQEQIPDLLQTPEIAKLDTLAKIIDYLDPDKAQKKTSLSIAP